MHPDELALPYTTEIPETATSGDIKVEYLEKDIQEVNEAIKLLNNSSKSDFKKLNEKKSEVRDKTAENHASLNKKMLEVNGQLKSQLDSFQERIEEADYQFEKVNELESSVHGVWDKVQHFNRTIMRYEEQQKTEKQA